ncbi:hypothetical protein BKH42_03415 [Helicobacter sp. 13S00482-2]|uniref:hypothetical protein n=1 Tax=Helicobacter sp. 13S00482-2 TaxID=1476200 RepID=UPI000BA616C4|nr:hypothetical protein [Helicobacter sp. 13S00482-2]PAF54026.1 hypothetical protein BKH42_03415 [Helicobacter sp. 13S00482-2]
MFDYIIECAINLIPILLLLFPMINLIMFYMDNQFSKVDKIVFIIIFIAHLFTFNFIIFILQDNYLILFIYLFIYMIIYLLFFIHIKIKNNKININDISLIIYISLFIPVLFAIVFYQIGSYFTTFKDVDLLGELLIAWFIFFILADLYILVFSINIIIRIRAFIKKRRNNTIR